MIFLISLEKVTEVIRLTAEHSLRAMHLLYCRAATIFEAMVHVEQKSFFSMYINALEIPSGDRERLPVQCSISTKYSKLSNVKQARKAVAGVCFFFPKASQGQTKAWRSLTVVNECIFTE